MIWGNQQSLYGQLYRPAGGYPKPNYFPSPSPAGTNQWPNAFPQAPKPMVNPGMANAMPAIAPLQPGMLPQNVDKINPLRQQKAWNKHLTRLNRLDQRKQYRQQWLWNMFGHSDSQSKFRENYAMSQAPSWGRQSPPVQQLNPWMAAYTGAVSAMQ